MAELIELVGPGRRDRSPRRDLLRRHAPPPGSRARTGARPGGPVPRRADDRPGPGQPAADLGRGAAPQPGAGTHGLPDDAVSRGSRRARRSRRDHRQRTDRCRGHAGRAQADDRAGRGRRADRGRRRGRPRGARGAPRRRERPHRRRGADRGRLRRTGRGAGDRRRAQRDRPRSRDPALVPSAFAGRRVPRGDRCPDRRAPPPPQAGAPDPTPPTTPIPTPAPEAPLDDRRCPRRLRRGSPPLAPASDPLAGPDTVRPGHAHGRRSRDPSAPARAGVRHPRPHHPHLLLRA